MTETSNPPIRRIRRGPIQAAIWKNSSADKGPYFVTTFERRYRDESGVWKSTQGFARDDLLLLAKVSELAVEAIFEMQESEREHQTSGNPNEPEACSPGGGVDRPSVSNSAAAAAGKASMRTR